MKYVVVLAALVTVIASPVFAEQITAKQGRMYLELELGTVMPKDIGISATTNSGGVTTTGSGSFSFDNGYVIGALVGYQHSKWFAGEVELAYSQFDYDSLSGTVSVTSGGSTAAVSGTEKVDGDVSSLLSMVNVLVTPPAGRFRPYFGGGVGLAFFDEEIRSIGGTALNVSNDATALAYQMKLGLDYRVGEGFSVGTSYTYLGADTGTDYSEDFKAHAVFLKGMILF